MIRRAFALALPLALAACATSTPPPPAATDAPPSAPSATRSPAMALPPQPPERPVAPADVTDPAIPREQRVAHFVDYTARTYGIDPAVIRATLAQARAQPRIVEIISRPAEAVRPWKDYRPIFLNDARIDGGVAFYRENRAALDGVATESGVPAEYIVAIIGVETQYGRNMGSYRVLDALYTLAFDYPRRAPFFAGELAQLFALGKAEPQLDIAQLKGSYAGAMGMGQFMPSSYRLWARDGDGDGRRDLLTHKPDVFASIANYFVVHGWQRGQPVVARAEKDPNLPEWTPEVIDTVHTLAGLARRGYRPLRGQPRRDGATVINFEGDAGREYWIGYGNFYVITRYNRSPMYSLAVHQLAQAIRAGVDRR
ncbi:lytic murein transglycosylase B [Lysobacter pythonis]|uniref:Lytic murein transglycosylase B n=1 Tax=Solilutibacter pythonis TaxID=2483112 RepID=A0A3M2HNE8_9GAMM|nr:lytic murein transglycosylase B [Lysobacter pythonis]RMH89090.1 lytic murein transglycosylase B [Lysobacter pythonis]